jgi:superoxide dismutase
MNADFSETTLQHEAFEEFWLSAERITMRHQHGHQAYCTGVSNQLDDLGFRSEGYFAVG